MPFGPGWRANQPQRKTAQSGFVLEGVREDYSGSMSVFPCRGMFRRLAVVGLPAKTHRQGLVSVLEWGTDGHTSKYTRLDRNRPGRISCLRPLQ